MDRPSSHPEVPCLWASPTIHLHTIGGELWTANRRGECFYKQTNSTSLSTLYCTCAARARVSKIYICQVLTLECEIAVNTTLARRPQTLATRCSFLCFWIFLCSERQKSKIKSVEFSKLKKHFNQTPERVLNKFTAKVWGVGGGSNSCSPGGYGGGNTQRCRRAPVRSGAESGFRRAFFETAAPHGKRVPFLYACSQPTSGCKLKANMDC